MSYGYPEVEGVAIVVGPREPVERAVRRFRKLVGRSGVLTDVKGKRWAETRNERRRRKHAKAAHWRARAAEQ